ncbi:MAG TPA: DedA family protein [Gaiellales bacterium]|nr:DedA family protein [Gaiellales bacterium]
MSSAEALLDSLGAGLGPWSYALVGGLAFLETSAFIGLIAPGELAVVLGGVLAGRGQMELPLLVAVVWAAAVAGDVCGFLLGRGLGRPFLVRHGARLGATPARLDQVDRFFARHGAKAIVIGRFAGIVRAMGPFTAGASGMRPGRFVAADVLGAGLWAGTFTGLGYVFAGSVGALLDVLHRAQLAAAIALAAALVVAVVVRRRVRT